jgi:RNA polymerase sigma factor (TIGR02999 family)
MQALSSLISLVYPSYDELPGGTSHDARLATPWSRQPWPMRLTSNWFARGGVRCESRVHFLALCSQIIRRILVDHARNRGYAKRGGGAAQISLDEGVMAAKTREVDVLALNEALASLSEFDPRKARVVELRYFGGLSVEETAEVLGVSPETAKRDWKMAKAWLFGELTGEKDRTGA